MTVPCEYNGYGCDKVIKNKEMENHLKAACSKHLQMVCHAHEALREKHKTVEEEKKKLLKSKSEKEQECINISGELERVKTELHFVKETDNTWEKQLNTEG